MIPLKTNQDLIVMRKVGHVLAQIMDELGNMIKPGLLTIELDRAAESRIFQQRVKPAFKGYRGYPACVCVSVNEQVVHGIPGSRKLLEGDIVSLDLGIEDSGFFVDMAKTFAVGRIDVQKQKLLEVTEASFYEAMKFLKPSHLLSEACGALQDYVEKMGFSVVRDFVGHGIGRQLHEEPQIPNFRTSNNKIVLQSGMVLCIEPMINVGRWQVEILEDGWTAITADGRPSAHFEHTIAVREGDPEILTR